MVSCFCVPQGGNQSGSDESSSSDSSGSDDDDDQDDSDSSDSSAESEKIGDGLDSLIRDEEDRQKLASMTDIERELELYKR